jgi:hypothetical protein
LFHRIGIQHVTPRIKITNSSVNIDEEDPHLEYIKKQASGSLDNGNLFPDLVASPVHKIATHLKVLAMTGLHFLGLVPGT